MTMTRPPRPVTTARKTWSIGPAVPILDAGGSSVRACAICPSSAARECFATAALDALNLLVGPLNDVGRQRGVPEVGPELLAVIDRPVEQARQRDGFSLLGDALVGEDPGEAGD